MTNYASVLKELMIAGYEGASLLAAFDRMCAAIGGAVDGVLASTPKHAKPSQAKAVTPPPVSRAAVAYPPPEGAKAIGRKALAASGLSSSAIRVGSQLLEHYNVSTGRCDPGIAGVAAKTEMAPRSVQRAVSDLVGAGLFTVARNAGFGHRNAYFPVWPRLVEIAKGVTVLSSGGDKTVTQNQRTKPDSDSMPVKAPRGRKPDHVPGQRFLPLMRSMDGGRSVASPQQAEAAAEAVRARLVRQMHDHLTARLMPDKAAFVAAMVRAGEMDIGAVVAVEMNRKGSGLGFWLGLMEAKRATA